jgi:hypothetical protein
MNLASLRAQLPLHEGDSVPADRQRDGTALGKAIGREVQLSFVCCLADGRSMAYVGIAETGVPPLEYHARPQQQMALPAEVMSIFQKLEKHLDAAIERGDSGEDQSKGYALSSDAALRADQLELRAWSRAHTELVLKVLAGARNARQRGYAAEALGYADNSPQQIAALVEAAFDSDGNVRNNAIRALWVLCSLGPEVTNQIPGERFIPLLHSSVWSDRNKGSLLMLLITKSRDPKLLKILQTQALAPLREMAQWRNPGHASPAIVILGRMAGIAESRLDEPDAAVRAEILKYAASLN